jgi:hypothetical protein
MKRQDRIILHDDRIKSDNDRITPHNDRISPHEDRISSLSGRKKISSISSMKEIFD